MSQSALGRWTEAEFFAWHDGQEEPHEFVDGFPQAMTRGNDRHTRIVINAFQAFVERLGGGPCWPSPFETGVRIPANGNIRYPDLTVDCGPYRPDERVAAEPVLVLEVLSRYTRALDQTRKVEEYRTVPGLACILLLDPDAKRAHLFSRAEDGSWQWQVIEDATAELALSALGIALSLDACYGDALG
jgi:Uma2 family endonuclease